MAANIIILSAILLGLLALIFQKKKISAGSYQYLLFYLIANFCFEVIAFYLSEKSRSNYEIYNMQMIVEVSFFLSLYRKIAPTKNTKKYIGWAIIIFILFSTINLLTFQSIKTFNTNTYTLGSFLLIFTCANYLYYSILKDEIKNPIFSLMFWVSLGVLFCYLGNFPFLSNVNRLFTTDKAMALRVQVISIAVNVLLYLSIATGILCNKTD